MSAGIYDRFRSRLGLYLRSTRFGTTHTPHVRAESASILIDAMDATTGWAALGNDTTGLETDLDHVLGTASLEFDKVDGAANTVFAGIGKTIDSLDLSAANARDTVRVAFKLSSITNVAYAFVRLGTSASHYNEWRVADSDITAAEWNVADILIGKPSATLGNGWDPSAVTYAAVGVAFDAEANTLADIRFDHLAWMQSVRTDAREAGTTPLGSVTVTGDALNALQTLDNVVDGTASRVKALGTAAAWITDGNISADYTSAAIDLTAISGPFYLLVTFADNSAGDLYVKGSTSSTVADHIPIALTTVNTDNASATLFTGPASSIGITDPGASGVKLLISFDHPPAPYVSIFFDRSAGAADGLDAAYYTQSL